MCNELFELVAELDELPVGELLLECNTLCTPFEGAGVSGEELRVVQGFSGDELEELPDSGMLAGLRGGVVDLAGAFLDTLLDSGVGPIFSPSLGAPFSPSLGPAFSPSLGPAFCT